jgi:hypothetical protein
MLCAIVNRAKTVLLALTSSQWGYRNALMIIKWGMKKNILKERNEFSPPSSKLVA